MAHHTVGVVPPLETRFERVHSARQFVNGDLAFARRRVGCSGIADGENRSQSRNRAEPLTLLPANRRQAEFLL